MVDGLDELRDRTRHLEEAELALVRSVINHPQWLREPDEHALRYALNLARTTRIRTPDGTDLDLEPFLLPFRTEVESVVDPLLARPGGVVDRNAVGRLAPHLATHARSWRSRLARTFGDRLPIESLDRELCEKALVLVGGGGGGVSYVFLGAFALLEQYGLVPRLLAGASMGANLLLFRARKLRYDPEEFTESTRGVSYRTLFKLLRTESRYGIPGAMRLHLRSGLGAIARGEQGRITLGELPIPLLVSVTGVRSGALPHDPSYYENLIDLTGKAPPPHVAKRMVTALLGTLTELLTQRDRFARLCLGSDEETKAFDAIDAVGFSSSLPGVIHYDVLREDDRMHGILGGLFEKHDIFRLMDGGIADNVPAKAAWAAVQDGMIQTRNAFILAFDAFAPKLSQPLWFAIEQLVQQNVARNLPFVHHYKSFQQVLSPLELVPSADHLRRATQWGKQELLPDMPLVARMCRPFPALQ